MKKSCVIITSWQNNLLLRQHSEGICTCHCCLVSVLSFSKTVCWQLLRPGVAPLEAREAPFRNAEHGNCSQKLVMIHQSSPNCLNQLLVSSAQTVRCSWTRLYPGVPQRDVSMVGRTPVYSCKNPLSGICRFSKDLVNDESGRVYKVSPSQNKALQADLPPHPPRRPSLPGHFIRFHHTPLAQILLLLAMLLKHIAVLVAFVPFVMSTQCDKGKFWCVTFCTTFDA